jgi:hypothetical protein
LRIIQQQTIKRQIGYHALMQNGAGRNNTAVGAFSLSESYGSGTTATGSVR